MATGPRLCDVLASLGWRTEARHNALGQGKRVIDADGRDLGDMTASETWTRLRALGLYPKKGRRLVTAIVDATDPMRIRIKVDAATFETAAAAIAAIPGEPVFGITFPDRVARSHARRIANLSRSK